MAIIDGEGALHAYNTIKLSGEAAVTKTEILEAITKSKEAAKIVEIVKDTLDRHSIENFKSLQEFLDIGFSPDVIEVLKLCNELIQLFN